MLCYYNWETQLKMKVRQSKNLGYSIIFFNSKVHEFFAWGLQLNRKRLPCSSFWLVCPPFLRKKMWLQPLTSRLTDDCFDIFLPGVLCFWGVFGLVNGGEELSKALFSCSPSPWSRINNTRSTNFWHSSISGFQYYQSEGLRLRT